MSTPLEPTDLLTDRALFPAPASTAEKDAFHALQRQLAPMFERVFPNPQVPRTVLVVPSLSMDSAELAKIDGIHHYEERMLCLLMLLQLPRTRVIYVTSQPLHPAVVDYYLHLLPGVPTNHARRRLTLLACYDGSPRPLSQKILERPRLMREILAAVPDRASAHITCFNTTALERTLAVRLGIPLYACDPDLCYLGSKSKGRQIFREAGIAVPDGFEDLRDEADIVDALVALKQRRPDLARAVVKLNDGFSGEGNALFSFTGFDDRPAVPALRGWVRAELPRRLRFEAQAETWPDFRTKFAEMGGVVECFVEGDNKQSPSVQCRIDPLGQPVIVSTHDQVLGGPSGQIFLGCTFPAAADYRLDIQEAGLRVAKVLVRYGALGRFGVDFISVPTADGWQHYAIEINLRKGGTTLPYLMLEFLTDGQYDVETGLYHTPAGPDRYYYATDNLQNDRYRGLTPDDLIDIAVYNRLHFHAASQQGVVFHLIGALSEFGKLGVVCIGDSPARARELYETTVGCLDLETRVRA